MCSALSDTAGVGNFLAQVRDSICPALSPSQLLLDLISLGCFLKAAISEGSHATCLLTEAGPCGQRAEKSWAESLGCFFRLNLLLF